MRRTPLKRYARLRITVPLKYVAKGRPVGRKLKRKRSTGKPTAAQAARWVLMRERGCICCRLNIGGALSWATFGQNNLEIHHLLSGGLRIGHDATICLCHFHHQGKRLPLDGSGYTEQASIFGPSLEREPAQFREVYGREERLLVLQNELIGRSAT